MDEVSLTLREEDGVWWLIAEDPIPLAGTPEISERLASHEAVQFLPDRESSEQITQKEFILLLKVSNSKVTVIIDQSQRYSDKEL